MIRVSAGGLLALSNELRGTSGLHMDEAERVEELADMIVKVFLPNPSPPDWRDGGPAVTPI